MNISKIKKEVHRMDEKLDESDAAFQVAVLLIAGTETQDMRKLQMATGYSRPFLESTRDLLKKAGIWRRGRTYHSGWTDKETAGAAFWMDVCVGLGFMERV